jgi:hypothetical protein
MEMKRTLMTAKDATPCYSIDPVDYSRMRVNMFWAINGSGLPSWARDLLSEAYDTLTKMQTKQWDCDAEG